MLFLLLLISPLLAAKVAPEELTKALAGYQQKPTRRHATEYLHLLPSNGRQLEKLLIKIGPRHQVLDYVFVLEKIANSMPDETIHKLILLNRNSEWRGGVISDMQLVSAKVYLAQLKVFAKQMNQLSEREQGKVIAFLASGRQSPAPGYKQLKRMLELINEQKLADIMTAYQS